MSTSDWLVALVSFLGAGVGGALGWLGARQGTAEVRTDARREEWGRRFTTALAAVGSADERQRSLGRIILVQLARSSLASDDDRQLADRVLESIAQPPVAVAGLPADASTDPDRVGASRALIELRGTSKVDPAITALAAQALPWETATDGKAPRPDPTR